MAAYQYTLQYRNGKNMEVADALSRLPLPARHNDESEECLAVFDSTPITASQVTKWTKRDPILEAVRQFTVSGWPATFDGKFQPFYVRRHELSHEQGCLTWGQRVIVPDTLRQPVLSLLHEEHPGIERMKMLARSFVWWPLMDKDIESTVRKCNVCQTTAPAKTPGPLHPWTYPTRVWQRVHVDFAVKEGINLFVLVDSYSKWIEVRCLSTATAARTTDTLRAIFAAYGYPEELVSDNGPQFIAQEFADFTRGLGIRHTRTPPYHAASNGAAERLVQTTKTILLKQVLHDNMTGQRRTLHQRLDDFLLAYRNTANSVTGRTPAELFLKRQPRVKLSLLKPDFVKDMRTKQEQNAARRNEHRGRATQFTVGEIVYVKTTRGEPLAWEEATVVQQVSEATFLVKVNNQLRYVHSDHLKPRWARASPTSFRHDRGTSAMDEAPSGSQNLPTTPLYGDRTSSDTSSDTQAPVEGDGATPLAPTEPAVQPGANVTSDVDVTNPHSEPLRRSSRRRQPPERFQAGMP
ncbi:uncharacterized protein K02A2.6-like [Ornithodoros turicata]|uniref:uncharacterized protein K02A2.6-like n=1 Tax=Ornithodoros turicata TaxID=34597 RepID=UPI00313876F4